MWILAIRHRRVERVFRSPPSNPTATAAVATSTATKPVVEGAETETLLDERQALSCS